MGNRIAKARAEPPRLAREIWIAAICNDAPEMRDVVAFDWRECNEPCAHGQRGPAEHVRLALRWTIRSGSAQLRDAHFGRAQPNSARSSAGVPSSASTHARAATGAACLALDETVRHAVSPSDCASYRWQPNHQTARPSVHERMPDLKRFRGPTASLDAPVGRGPRFGRAAFDSRPGGSPARYCVSRLWFATDVSGPAER